jgi:hypothetical protein
MMLHSVFQYYLLLPYGFFSNLQISQVSNVTEQDNRHANLCARLYVHSFNVLQGLIAAFHQEELLSLFQNGIERKYAKFEITVIIMLFNDAQSMLMPC